MSTVTLACRLSTFLWPLFIFKSCGTIFNFEKYPGWPTLWWTFVLDIYYCKSFLWNLSITWRWCLNISSFMMAKTAENLHLADRWYSWYLGKSEFCLKICFRIRKWEIFCRNLRQHDQGHASSALSDHLVVWSDHFHLVVLIIIRSPDGLIVISP